MTAVRPEYAAALEALERLTPQELQRLRLYDLRTVAAWVAAEERQGEEQRGRVPDDERERE